MMSALMKKKELLESKADVEILRQLPNLYSKEWNIPIQVARRETKDVEIQHIRNLRKSMGWLPPPNTAAYDRIMAQRKAKELQLKLEHQRFVADQKNQVQENTHRDSKTVNSNVEESNGRYLVLTADLHETLKRCNSLIKRMEEREEAILELLEEVTEKMKRQQLVPREKGHPVLGVSKQQIHRLLGG